MKGTVVYFLFVILTCYTIQADDLLTSSLDTNDHNLTPCINHTDCDGFQDGKCVNSFCECNGTKFCEDKTDTIVTKLGESCKIDSDCNIEHSVCKENKCACDEGRVEASDERRCLTDSDQPCISQSLCNELESEKRNCIVGKCECEEERPYCTNNAHHYHQPRPPKEGSKHTQKFEYLYKKEEINLDNLVDLSKGEKFMFQISGFYLLFFLIISYCLITLIPYFRTEDGRVIPIVTYIFIFLGISVLIMIFYYYLPNKIYSLTMFGILCFIFMFGGATVVMVVILVVRWLELHPQIVLGVYLGSALTLMAYHESLPEILNKFNFATLFCVCIGFIFMLIRSLWQ